MKLNDESSAEQSERIAEAARELDRLRTGWLDPPQWTREEVLEFPGSARGLVTFVCDNPRNLRFNSERRTKRRLRR